MTPMIGTSGRNRAIARTVNPEREMQMMALAPSSVAARQVAIVIVSTEANEGRLSRLKTMGVVESLHKPFEPEDLCALISKTLGVKL